MKTTEQRTPLDYIREWLMPLVIAAFGWYMSSLISRVNAKIDILLEDKAAKTEQIRSLERAVFGKISKSQDNGYNKPMEHTLIFDKARWHYEKGKFIYS